MTYRNLRKKGVVIRNKILFIAILAVGSLLLTTHNLQAQSPSPSPSPTGSNDPVMLGGYKVASSIELGVRGLSVDGSNEKYRSDFNYRPGFRVFDSSFLMEAENGKGKAFDSLQITSSGWSSDPTGYVRVNMEKMGAYRFDANVRRVNLINQVSNLILGYKRSDTTRNFGDFDLTVLPQNENLRFRFGASFNNYSGDLGFTVRTRDVFPIVEKINSKTVDLRAGVDTKLLGFNLSFTGGIRQFNDRSKYVIDSRTLGFVPTDVNILNKLERTYPNTGDTKYGIFSMHRTFAKKLDLTGRFIYSVTDRGFNVFENFSGEGPVSRTVPTPIFIDADIFEINGRVKRPQSRGDLGVTYAITDKFRISNTFTFDQFNSYGDSDLAEKVVSRLQSTGAARPDTFTRSLFWRFNGFKRFTNTIEGDYQFNSRFGINIGYRYTHRKVTEGLFNRSITPLGNPTVGGEEEENSTNTVLFGTKIKPTKDWSIFADAEHGEADNAFTRLANYNFTNFRLRSNWHYKQFIFNVSGIVRNNENPSFTSAVGLVPASQLIANVRSRIFSAFVDWTPDPKWSFSTGYTYHYLNSRTNIVVPLAALTPGFSEFYIRDNYAFVDVSARPFSRVSIYASYRFNEDTGQGDTVSAVPQNIISSYPFRLQMPEVRVAIKLTKNIDWNVGYQYNNYREKLQIGYFSQDTFPLNVNFLPNQNYRAHLPYTSLRIYFGGADR